MQALPPLLLLFSFLCATSPLIYAAESPVILYSGRITGGDPAYTGAGQFKFALVNPAGQRVWSSDDNEIPIEGGTPSASVSLAVSRGVYQVRLGDTSVGMKPLNNAVAKNWAALRLQTWFNDGTSGWSDAGLAPLALSTTTPAAGSAPIGNTEADSHQAILAELGRLRAEVGAMHKELRAGKPPSEPVPQPLPAPLPVPVQVSLTDTHRYSLGAAKAPVVLVEFTDFECGFCKRFFEQTFPTLKAKFIDTGKLRFISRNFPVQRHPQAGPAATALLSAAAQEPGQYWAMRTWLFKDNRELSEAAYEKYAKEAGLDVPRFLSDFTTKRHAPELDADIAAAGAVGITGTPSFVLGTSDGKSIRGELILGAKSIEVFDRMIEALLAAQTSPSPSVAGTPVDVEKVK